MQVIKSGTTSQIAKKSYKHQIFPIVDSYGWSKNFNNCFNVVPKAHMAEPLRPHSLRLTTTRWLMIYYGRKKPPQRRLAAMRRDDRGCTFDTGPDDQPEMLLVHLEAGDMGGASLAQRIRTSNRRQPTCAILKANEVLCPDLLGWREAL
jgi:hypothetical protein